MKVRKHLHEAVQRLEALIADPTADNDALMDAASHFALNENLAVALLRRKDVPAAVVEKLAQSSRLMKLRKVRKAVIADPRTPRHVSLPQLRHLFTFDLMDVALFPQTSGDVKRAADEALVLRLNTLAAGERLTLARRGSNRIAAALLEDDEPRVIAAALDNPRLTEAVLVKALSRPRPSRKLTLDVCEHQKWSAQKDVRAVLLRNHYTPLAFAIRFSESFTPAALADIFRGSDLAQNTQSYLLKLAARRAERIRS